MRKLTPDKDIYFIFLLVIVFLLMRLFANAVEEKAEMCLTVTHQILYADLDIQEVYKKVEKIELGLH